MCNFKSSNCSFKELNSLQLHIYGGTELFAAPDIWHLPAGSAQYKVSKTYKLLAPTPQIMPVLRWLWKTYCQLKHTIFFWLVSNDRVNTRAMLQRKKILLGRLYTCVLYNGQALEASDHLFFHCPFAQLC